ncbi:hypothetical protein [Luteimonas sp. YGD11-2]|nr:hypothetical protein [Luteimonas sp. YGD11-2]
MSLIEPAQAGSFICAIRAIQAGDSPCTGVPVCAFIDLIESERNVDPD